MTQSNTGNNLNPEQPENTNNENSAAPQGNPSWLDAQGNNSYNPANNQAPSNQAPATYQAQNVQPYPQQNAPQYPNQAQGQYPQQPGYGYDNQPPQQQSYNQYPGVYKPKSQIAAALLAFFFGTLGVHNFYLGNTARGGVQLGLTLFGWATSWLLIGLPIIAGVAIWAFIEFILILVGTSGYNRDGNGQPLQ